MDNEILAVARVGLSVDITATFNDDSGFIGVSMTFKIDVIIFAALPAPSKQTTSRVPSLKTNAKKYLQDKATILKSIYTGWENYLDNNQNRILGTVFQSFSDLEENIKEIVLEQGKVRSQIEKVITDVYSELKTANLNEDDTRETLKFLSNCYQIIRDLSISACLCNQTLEYNVEPTADADSIRKELLQKYSKNKIIEKVKKRKSISESILSKSKEVSELKLTLFGFENELSGTEDQKLTAVKKVECRKASMPLIQRAVEEWNELEAASLKTRLEIINSEIAEYEKKIAELSADQGFFSKKKSQLVIAEFQKFLSKALQEKDALEKQIVTCKLSTTEDQFTYISEAKIEENPEFEKMRKEMAEIKEKIIKLKGEIDKLLAEYEIIVKEFA